MRVFAACALLGYSCSARSITRHVQQSLYWWEALVQAAIHCALLALRPGCGLCVDWEGDLNAQLSLCYSFYCECTAWQQALSAHCAALHYGMLWTSQWHALHFTKLKAQMCTDGQCICQRGIGLMGRARTAHIAAGGLQYTLQSGLDPEDWLYTTHNAAMYRVPLQDSCMMH